MRRHASIAAYRRQRRKEAGIPSHRQARPEVIAWVGEHILPNEADVRARLARMGVPDGEIGDIVQDAYVAIARLDSVAHIRNPRAYFFTTARHALLQRVRHDRIVRIDTLTEAQALVLPDDEPDPHRHTSARLELRRVQRLIDALPQRCRAIFVQRRIHGIAQRDIAAQMGVSEAVVEAQAARGLRLIMQAIETEEAAAAGAWPVANGQDYDRHQQ